MFNALYYPTIEFQNPALLKRSLLVWERVFRIVPPRYHPHDDPEVREAVAEGVIVNIAVDNAEKQSAAERFLDFYYEHNSPNSRLVWPAGLSAEPVARLSPEKVDGRLVPLLEKLASGASADGFLELRREIAGSYMFYLASSVAEQRALGLVTDSADYWSAGTYFANSGNFTEQVYADGADRYLANLAIEDLLPADLEAVPIDKVLEFRERHKEERATFQIELEALRTKLATCPNKQHAEFIVNDFVKRFQDAKTAYRQSMGFFGKREIYSILSVGVPAALAVLSLPVGPGVDPYDAVRLGAGTLIGAVAALAARDQNAPRLGVASYLVSAERLMGENRNKLHRIFEEFIND